MAPSSLPTSEPCTDSMLPQVNRPGKRSRDEFTSTQEQSERSAKRTKRAQGTPEHNETKHTNYPPDFWNTLSKIFLTRKALQEFDRRVAPSRPARFVKKGNRPSRGRALRSRTRRLKAFAKDGGPDLNQLRGLSQTQSSTMSMNKSVPRGRKRNRSRNDRCEINAKVASTTAYSREFEQKLIDRRVYPDGYRHEQSRPPPVPENLGEIQDALKCPRASLSPSSFSDDAFEAFQDKIRRAKSESMAMAKVIPVIAGTDNFEHDHAAEVLFNRLEKFDESLCAPKPDTYYGAMPSQIEEHVRSDLEKYIVPSNTTSLPAAPNFFLECKGASGRADVGERQAMYYGALGARGMFQLQNYGKPTPVYDGNAYTLAAMYSNGQLSIFATHPRHSTSGATEYHTTQVDTYAIKGNVDAFRIGAAAYRNAREWTKEQRDKFIADANAMALTLSHESASGSQEESRSGSAKSLLIGDEAGSDNSVAEVTAEDRPRVKRARTDKR